MSDVAIRVEGLGKQRGVRAGTFEPCKLSSSTFRPPMTCASMVLCEQFRRAAKAASGASPIITPAIQANFMVQLLYVPLIRPAAPALG